MLLLILHDTHFGKTRLKESVADYVVVTPIVSKDGAVILGSKRNTVFEVNAKAGKILRSYGAADFHNTSTVLQLQYQLLQFSLASIVEVPSPTTLRSSFKGTRKWGSSLGRFSRLVGACVFVVLL